MNPSHAIVVRPRPRKLAGILAVSVVLSASVSLHAQNRLYIEEHTVAPGDTNVAVPILLDSDQPLYGYQLSLVTDPTKLRFDDTPISLVGSASASADFSAGGALEGGARLSWGVILDTSEPFDVNKVIPPGTGTVLASAVFDVEPSASGTATLAFEDFPSDFVSDPPDPGAKNKLALENGDPLAHTQSDGTITIEGGGDGVGPFLRGDCNQDGESLGSPTDGIFLLTYLFIGGTVPTCIAACDMDGDGEVSGSPTDALYFFNFNFLGDPPLPEPLRECALSSEADDVALGCEIPAGCAG